MKTTDSKRAIECMTAEQYEALDIGATVTLLRSGKVYMVLSKVSGRLCFRQVRDGKGYGPSGYTFAADKLAPGDVSMYPRIEFNSEVAISDDDRGSLRYRLMAMVLDRVDVRRPLPDARVSTFTRCDLNSDNSIRHVCITDPSGRWLARIDMPAPRRA